MSVKSMVMDHGMRAASTRKRLVMMEVVRASATVFLSGYVPSLITSARSYLREGRGAPQDPVHTSVLMWVVDFH